MKIISSEQETDEARLAGVEVGTQCNVVVAGASMSRVMCVCFVCGWWWRVRVRLRWMRVVVCGNEVAGRWQASVSKVSSRHNSGKTVDVDGSGKWRSAAASKTVSGGLRRYDGGRSGGWADAAA